jgi:predicted cupin superfamily sugar epimerase
MLIMTYTAQELIKKLKLQPHPEGGWYAFVSRSGISIPTQLLTKDYSGERDTCSIIYYMLCKGEISRWHRLLSSEVWAWHMGGSLEMTLGGTDEKPIAVKTLALGSGLERSERMNILVPAGQWQTTRVTEGEFVLVSCVVAPAFHDDDCILPEHPLDNEIYG